MYIYSSYYSFFWGGSQAMPQIHKVAAVLHLRRACIKIFHGAAVPVCSVFPAVQCLRHFSSWRYGSHQNLNLRGPGCRALSQILEQGNCLLYSQDECCTGRSHPRLEYLVRRGFRFNAPTLTRPLRAAATTEPFNYTSMYA